MLMEVQVLVWEKECKTKFHINKTFNKVQMQEIFVNLTRRNKAPVYSKHKIWFQGGSVQTGYTVLYCITGIVCSDFCSGNYKSTMIS